MKLYAAMPRITEYSVYRRRVADSAWIKRSGHVCLMMWVVLGKSTATV